MSLDLNIFVSYRREEVDLRNRVIAALQAENFTTFADAEIEKGVNFNDVLDRMVRSAKLTLVLWTNAATQSKWIPMEARLAKRLYQESKKQDQNVENIYLPIYIGDLGTNMPMDLADDQGLEFPSPLTDAALAEIVAEVTQLIGARDQNTAISAPDNSSALEHDLRQYQFALKVDSIKAYDIYLRDFPDGTFARDATERRAALSNSESAAMTQKALAAPPTVENHTEANGNSVENNSLRKEAFWGVFIKGLATGAIAIGIPVAGAVALGVYVPQSHVSDAKSHYEERLEKHVGESDAALADLNDQRDIAEAEVKRLQAEAISLKAESGRLEAEKDQVARQLSKLERAMSEMTNATCPDRFGKKHLWVVNTCVNFDATSLSLEKIGSLTLNGVRDLSQLKKLFINGADNISLSTIQDLPLTHLSLRSTNITDISPLADMKHLESVNLSPSQIDNLAPLADLPNLRVLYAPNGNVYLNRASVELYQNTLK